MNTVDALANRHFLVVDDEAFIRTLVARFLMRSGAANVVEAVDGREANALIGSYEMRFDAVITDVNMRPVNGIELLRAIRTGAGGLKRNTPVLMLTVHAETDLVSEALALDADAFILKPVEREALIERVVRILHHVAPLAPAAHYAAVGRPEGASIETPPSLAGAPPTRPLEISAENLFAAEKAPPQDPQAVAHSVPLDKVRTNSILAEDIRLAGSRLLLVAAPVILTKALLDRLKDLRKIHTAHTDVLVYEPA
jgi:CheY-like chemotaxis protein